MAEHGRKRHWSSYVLADRMQKSSSSYFLQHMTTKLKLAAFSLSIAISCNIVHAQGGMDSSKHNEMAQHVNRGVSLMRSRQYDAAMSEFEAARAIDPKNSTVKFNIAECHNNKGVSLYRQKVYADAVVEFEHCLELNPAHPQARHNINLCHQRMDIEGIPDAPSGAEEKEGGEKKKGKETAESEKKEDSGPKASSAAPEVTVSSGGAKLYSTGTLFPQYKEAPSAVTVPTVPFATAASGKGASAGSPGSSAASGITSAAGSSGASNSNTTVSSDNSKTGASTTAGGATPAIINSADSGGTSKSSASAFGGDAFDPGSTPGPVASTSGPPAAGSAFARDPVVPQPTAATSAKASVPDTGIAVVDQSPSFGTSAVNTTNATLPAPTNYTAGAEGLTLEDKVSALEMKVYGKKNSNLPIMKRIEQLETDYVGQVKQGPMNERVEFLKRAIGHGQ